MKVLALNGSPNKTAIHIRRCRSLQGELAAQNIEVETITIGDKIIQGCTGCRGCRTKGIAYCRIRNFAEIMSKVHAADGLILGSPVYYGGINGTMKSFLDRAFFSDVKGQMRFKVGASVVVLRETAA